MVFAIQLGIMPAGGRGETVSIGGFEFSFLTDEASGTSSLQSRALQILTDDPPRTGRNPRTDAEQYGEIRARCLADRVHRFEQPCSAVDLDPLVTIF
ncbi:hypothetical protein MUU53_05750 [Rhizobium lemnae]|uniref:Uncharacterized protein n=1 Tax=Rhizobium lemnae TaxID=1214924 RepID=A0ABV8EBF0_9HYPH|nr:hypothetical protein [Rhizobium lemnae]MCJ8507416.1 hypothetical protein [Rhizobium lemnae]